MPELDKQSETVLKQFLMEQMEQFRTGMSLGSDHIEMLLGFFNDPKYAEFTVPVLEEIHRIKNKALGIEVDVKPYYGPPPAAPKEEAKETGPESPLPEEVKEEVKQTPPEKAAPVPSAQTDPVKPAVPESLAASGPAPQIPVELRRPPGFRPLDALEQGWMKEMTVDLMAHNRKRYDKGTDLCIRIGLDALELSDPEKHREFVAGYKKELEEMKHRPPEPKKEVVALKEVKPTSPPAATQPSELKPLLSQADQKELTETINGMLKRGDTGNPLRGPMIRSGLEMLETVDPEKHREFVEKCREELEGWKRPKPAEAKKEVVAPKEVKPANPSPAPDKGFSLGSVMPEAPELPQVPQATKPASPPAAPDRGFSLGSVMPEAPESPQVAKPASTSPIGAKEAPGKILSDPELKERIQSMMAEVGAPNSRCDAEKYKDISRGLRMLGPEYDEFKAFSYYTISYWDSTPPSVKCDAAFKAYELCSQIPGREMEACTALAVACHTRKTNPDMQSQVEGAVKQMLPGKIEPGQGDVPTLRARAELMGDLAKRGPTASSFLRECAQKTAVVCHPTDMKAELRQTRANLKAPPPLARCLAECSPKGFMPMKPLVRGLTPLQTESIRATNLTQEVA